MLSAAEVFPIMDMLYGLAAVFWCFGLIALLCSVFWIWMLIDCAKNEPSGRNDKIIWILVILLTHFLGALIYFVTRRDQRRRELGR